ncbi:MAG: hypothetical protein AMJ53_01960 [Gammaproteobacteria bacterium SG8_11]|nr:MAG: hypothetical protein AMJ53_01960 [Gammaproteobacteria bacterium SG8_11]
MRKIYAVVTGATIGAVLGYVTDQMLTSYVLQNAEEAMVILMTNALSAFLMIPLLIILFSYLSYRMMKKRS